MNRRSFLQSALLGTTALFAAPPKMKITRVRFYESPISRPMFNQSFHIVCVDTDQGITGIGEGGSMDTIRECAEMVLGDNPMRIDHLWQLMYRGRFYPAGREKLHAMGAIDLALWDIKGKALGVPVYELLGGKSREHVECYSTGFPSKGDLTSTTRACIEYGFRAFRTSVSELSGGNPVFNSRHMVHKTFENCQAIREGVGKQGDWCIDYHTRLDFPDAVRLSTLIEPLDRISLRISCDRRTRMSTRRSGSKLMCRSRSASSSAIAGTSTTSSSSIGSTTRAWRFRTAVA